MAWRCEGKLSSQLRVELFKSKKDAENWLAYANQFDNSITMVPLYPEDTKLREAAEKVHRSIVLAIVAVNLTADRVQVSELVEWRDRLQAALGPEKEEK
jgi:hypothetical protein